MTPPETTASPDTPEASSPDAQSTPAPAASSAETALAYLTDPTKNSTKPLTDTINLSHLSPTKQAFLELIPTLTAQGYSESELARALGHSTSWLQENLSELRNELLAQSGRLRDLTPTETETLRDSIQAVGVQQPVAIALVNNRLDMIDGRNRYALSLELGLLDQLPWIYLGTLQPETAREIAFALNAARRHLTTDDKRVLVDAELTHNPARSDREIARTVGVTHPTVAARRAQLEADRLILEAGAHEADTDPFEHLDQPKVAKPSTPRIPPQYPDTRQDRRGGTQSSPRSAPAAPPPAREPAPEPAAATQQILRVPCPNCDAILTDGLPANGRRLRILHD